MNRFTYIKNCIKSAVFLSSSSFVTDEQKEFILSAANKMMNEAWKVEYISYSKSFGGEFLDVQIRQFWHQMTNDLETENDLLVYSFNAIYGEEVNPPGIKGNVEITIQPNKSIETYRFKLSLEKS